MDWSELTLFLLILARMSGCVLFNPLLGRQSVPGIVKSGLILLLAVTAAAMTGRLCRTRCWRWRCCCCWRWAWDISWAWW